MTARRVLRIAAVVILALGLWLAVTVLTMVERVEWAVQAWNEQIEEVSK